MSGPSLQGKLSGPTDKAVDTRTPLHLGPRPLSEPSSQLELAEGESLDDVRSPGERARISFDSGTCGTSMSPTTPAQSVLSPLSPKAGALVRVAADAVLWGLPILTPAVAFQIRQASQRLRAVRVCVFNFVPILGANLGRWPEFLSAYRTLFKQHREPQLQERLYWMLSPLASLVNPGVVVRELLPLVLPALRTMQAHAVSPILSQLPYLLSFLRPHERLVQFKMLGALKQRRQPWRVYRLVSQQLVALSCLLPPSASLDTVLSLAFRMAHKEMLAVKLVAMTSVSLIFLRYILQFPALPRSLAPLVMVRFPRAWYGRSPVPAPDPRQPKPLEPPPAGPFTSAPGSPVAGVSAKPARPPAPPALPPLEPWPVAPTVTQQGAFSPASPSTGSQTESSGLQPSVKRALGASATAAPVQLDQAVYGVPRSYLSPFGKLEQQYPGLRCLSPLLHRAPSDEELTHLVAFLRSPLFRSYCQRIDKVGVGTSPLIFSRAQPVARSAAVLLPSAMGFKLPNPSAHPSSPASSKPAGLEPGPPPQADAGNPSTSTSAAVSPSGPGSLVGPSARAAPGLASPPQGGGVMAGAGTSQLGAPQFQSTVLLPPNHDSPGLPPTYLLSDPVTMSRPLHDDDFDSGTLHKLWDGVAQASRFMRVLPELASTRAFEPVFGPGSDTFAPLPKDAAAPEPAKVPPPPLPHPTNLARVTAYLANYHEQHPVRPHKIPPEMSKSYESLLSLAKNKGSRYRLDFLLIAGALVAALPPRILGEVLAVTLATLCLDPVPSVRIRLAVVLSARTFRNQPAFSKHPLIRLAIHVLLRDSCPLVPGALEPLIEEIEAIEAAVAAPGHSKPPTSNTPSLGPSQTAARDPLDLEALQASIQRAKLLELPPFPPPVPTQTIPDVASDPDPLQSDPGTVRAFRRLSLRASQSARYKTRSGSHKSGDSGASPAKDEPAPVLTQGGLPSPPSPSPEPPHARLSLGTLPRAPKHIKPNLTALRLIRDTPRFPAARGPSPPQDPSDATT